MNTTEMIKAAAYQIHREAIRELEEQATAIQKKEKPDPKTRLSDGRDK